MRTSARARLPTTSAISGELKWRKVATMSNRNHLFRSAGYCLSAARLLTAATSSAWADPTTPVNPLQKRFLTGKALDVCDFGAFFVGGVPKVPSFGTVRQTIIGSMYTQFMIP